MSRQAGDETGEAGHLDASLGRAIEDKVVAYAEAAKTWGEIHSLFTH